MSTTKYQHRFYVEHPEFRSFVIRGVKLINTDEFGKMRVSLSVIATVDTPIDHLLYPTKEVSGIQVHFVDETGKIVDSTRLKACRLIGTSMDIDWSSDDPILVKIDYHCQREVTDGDS